MSKLRTLIVILGLFVSSLVFGMESGVIRLEIGTKIILTGLLSEKGQALNGKEGTVVGFHEDSGRYIIKLANEELCRIFKKNIWKVLPRKSKRESAGSEVPKKKQRKPKKKLQWKGDLKEDGLKPDTDMFHEYMKDVFRNVVRVGGETTVSILAKNLKVQELIKLRTMLEDLIKRCKKSPKGRALILHKGGGSVGSIALDDVQYLISHVEYLNYIIGKVEIVKAKQEKKKK